MPCGPASGVGSAPSQEDGSDPFAFRPEAPIAHGLHAMTLFWSAPWRAAMIVAGEALREGSRRG